MLGALANPGNFSYLAAIPSPDQLLVFKKSASAEVVNILWFAALGSSLASVLVAMLAKQWLRAYISEQHAEPRKAACERQRRFDGLQKWSLPHIMAFLPALLHASLFLFLVGLIIYLWQLDSMVSALTCVILGTLFILYFASVALAIFNSSCPYITPLSQFIRSHLTIANQSAPHFDDLLVPRAMMWLACAKDPKTISAALQSLAGLRRGFVGYDLHQSEHLAKLALERLRGCFIPDGRHCGTYHLRTEKQYEASCYARTLMNFFDDSRCGHRAFEIILNDSSLPVFMKLLGECQHQSLALLGLCDNQRFLHRTELSRWLVVRGFDGSVDKLQAGKFVRRRLSRENMTRILEVLNKYIKGDTFLQPFAIEIAVETMGFAPLPWVASVAIKEPQLWETLLTLLRLQHATRDGGLGIRRSIACTLAIFAGVHAPARNAEPDADFANRFDVAMATIASIEGRDNSEETARNILMHGLSHFAACKQDETHELLISMIIEALFYEVDRQIGSEDLSFSDTAAVSALLPLLQAPSLTQDHKTQILTRLLANAVSAAPGRNLPEDSLLHRVTPRDPFPPDTVPILLATLKSNKPLLPTWLQDVCSLLFLITRDPTHRCKLLAETPLVIELIRNDVWADIANCLFWVLTNAMRNIAHESSSERMLLVVASVGVVNMLQHYNDKHGFTPADVHAWMGILPMIPVVSQETSTARVELVDSLYAGIQNQTEQKLTSLHRLRAHFMQFSSEPAVDYTLESALQALRDAKDGQRIVCIAGNWKDDEDEFVYPPHTLIPMAD